MTEEEKVAKLAGWSLRYRTGMTEMIVAGMGLDELNAQVEVAEKRFKKEQDARRDKERKSRIRRRF